MNTKIPPHIRETINNQQHSSEILIGWVQLLIVLFFTALYALSPKPPVAELGFGFESWVLGSYILFTIVRLTLAHKRRLPQWLLYISVVMDMALLLTLIWSFHLKYQQPASFYLKSPTLLYVFIFIALRSLRFQVRYVALSGITASVGWLIMVWYVMIQSDPIITRDFVEYMTSNSILIGAEVDKIISILVVTAVLMIAIARARKLLERAIIEQSTTAELSRFVPDEVAAKIKNSGERAQIGDGELREATILFMDIEGFSTISESLQPQELIRTLNEYFAVVTEPLQAHGGVINQYQGDAILATFNLPAPEEDHANKAIRAAFAIQKVLKNRVFGNNIHLHSRIGINTGVIVGGLVGTGHQLGYTVHGDDVNLAARLEQLNKEHNTRIIVSERTRELAGADQFDYRELGTVLVRGRRTPVTIYCLDV